MLIVLARILIHSAAAAPHKKERLTQRVTQ
jgi:hypothetical protein